MIFRSLWNLLVQPPSREPSALPSTTRSDHAVNPVLDGLNATGLPWRSTRSQLASTYGVRSYNPYQWDLVALDIRPPPLTGMLWPFTFQAFPRYAPAMPPATLSTHVSVGDDTEANIQSAAQQI